MDSQILCVLDRLGRDSEKEKLKESELPLDERMLAITEDTGRFLNILLSSQGFSTILEIGTSTGYSTLWMAEAVLHNGGRVVTIERTVSKIRRARRAFDEAGVSNIRIMHGEAEEILPVLRESFDFVFIDADKENVIEYFDHARRLVRAGGMICVDNMLYPEKFRDTMSNLKRHIECMNDIRTVTIPIGNGEELSLKL